MNSRLLQLQKEFPLPEKWGQPNVFTENLKIGNLDLKMVGLSLDEQTMVQATGSAVDLNLYPWDRAYFELVERGLLLEFERSSSSAQNNVYPIYNHKGLGIGNVGFDKVANQNSGVEANWQYSKSNGVGVHLSLMSAIKSSGWELIERDRILRFWYSKKSPSKIPIWSTVLEKEIHEFYDINAYLFQEPTDCEQNVWVVGIFGFPKESLTAPFVMGFGAGDTQKLAISKALGEIYQRLAFLWTEEKLEQLPVVKPSPDFHLEYYHCPASWPYLQNWLNGKLDLVPLDFRPVYWNDMFFAQLNNHDQHSKIYVVKAMSSKNIPLTFGNANPKILFPLVGQAAIHPIA